jgi:DNA-binding transcriptional LysR family regulator
MDRLTAERMFLMVVETGSFARAAERLRTGSGQASKLVQKLEADLGVKLLNRTTRALGLTEAGVAYAERLRGLIEALDDLTAEVQQAAVTPKGRLRLTAPLTFGTGRLAPILTDFAKLYPEISLEVQFTDRLVNLVEEGFDAAVRVGLSADTTLKSRRLCEARILTIAAPDYLARHGHPTSPKDLADHEAVIDLNLREPHSWRYHGGTVPVRGRLAFSNAQACLVAAEAGLGIVRSPDFVAAESLAAGRVVTLLEDYELPPSGIHFLYPADRRVTAKLRALIDHVAKALR